MKTRKIFLSLAVLFLGAVTGFAQAPQMGKWKLNEAKSKLAAGQTKNSMVTYEAADDGKTKVTVDGTDAAGNSVHNEWVGKFDGKDYPVTGDAASDARAYTKVDDRHLSLKVKKGGKVTGTVKIAVSADGKSRTVSQTTTDASGKKVSSTMVYDKQ